MIARSMFRPGAVSKVSTEGPAKDLSRRMVMAAGALGAGLVAAGSARAEPTPPSTKVRHASIRADGVDVFYREAGPADGPVFLLLHGFANSSFYFRHIMPKLGDRVRLIAPDLPSFGFTEVPEERGYVYDFASLSRTLAAFVDALGLKRYLLYVFDYGAPVGWELALAYPDRVAGIVSQNGNAYEEGLGEKAWTPLRAYWASPSSEKREALRSRMTLEGVKAAYFQGEADPGRIEPESYTLDAAILGRPGNADLQIDLKLDYKRNIERYPLYQAFFRERQPPLLAVWGKNDSFFVPPGAEAFRRDIPKAEVHFVDAGHFALESRGDEVVALTRPFLDRVLG